jgi:hypothetical protein
MSDLASSRHDFILTKLVENTHYLRNSMSAEDDERTQALVDERRQLKSEISDLQITDESISGALSANNLNTQSPEIEQQIEDWCNKIIAIPNTKSSFANYNYCNLFLNKVLPNAWNFLQDVLLILGPSSHAIIDCAINRGQKHVVVFEPTFDFAHARTPPGMLATIHYCKTVKEVEIAFTLLQSKASRVITVPCKNTTASDIDKRKTLSEAVDRGIKNRIANTITATKFGESWAHNTLKNLASSHNKPNLHQMEVKGVNHAIVVGSGPSLSKNINYLRKIQKHVFIVTALRSAPALIEAGIRPDLVIQLDAESDAVAVEFVRKNSPEFQNFLAEITINPAFFGTKCQNLIWSVPQLFFDVNEEFNITPTPFDAPSVSVYGFSLCYLLGFANICLVGMDLSADGERQYAENTETILPTHTDISLFNIEVPGFHGDSVKTRGAYLYQIRRFQNIAKDLAQKVEGIELFNATEGGAFIEGFTHCTLQDFFSRNREKFSSNKAVSFNANKHELTHQSYQKYLKHLVEKYENIIDCAIKITQADNNKTHFDSNNQEIERLVIQFQKLNKDNSFLQLSMQPAIAAAIGTDERKNKITSYADFFPTVIENAGRLIQTINDILIWLEERELASSGT